MKVNVVTYFIFLMLSFASYSQSMNRVPIERSLNSSSAWKFKKKGEAIWHSARVPGTVHTDLFNNKLIPDPFFGNNEKQLQWIENESWEYSTSVRITQKEMAQSHIELQFDGLDTYAKVYVNDSLIITADNMFRRWNVDVKKYLHKGENKLYILFESAVIKGKEEAKKIPYTLPGDEKVFARKAQYQYGWDWGPRFVTCGIWKSVKLIEWSVLKVNSVHFIQDSISKNEARVRFEFDISSDVDTKVDISANYVISFPGGNTARINEAPVVLKKGDNQVVLHCIIEEPKLWWCNGLGKQNLYPITLKIKEGDRICYHGIKTIGLRTIELIQDKDSIGASFYFKLNGVPVFMKGANYIPSDNFLPRMQKEDYKKCVKNAVEVNMNMLRVWGGGVYADDEFYNQCDEQGILVWQDFMFACAMYPGDNHFVNNVAQEVIDQVDRLRNHPSLALWCGNNEVDEGWKNWGWQKQYHYSEKDSSTIYQNNSILFNDFIKEIVNQQDGVRNYWPSSPSIGWGHPESLQQGDSHYWGVWWGGESFENYNSKVGRFVSEYGFQGMPDVTTFKKAGIFGSEKKGISKIDSVNYFAHQKNTNGYDIINTYMKRDYVVPKKFDDYSYVSQLLQAEGMKTAIEAHRRAKPYCMGSMYWQLNDCWPVTSWSSVDYYGNWKASHFQVRRSYKNVLIAVAQKNEQLQIYIINDGLDSLNQELMISLLNFKGETLWTKKRVLVIRPNSSNIYDSVSKAEFQKYDPQQVFLSLTLVKTSSLEEINELYYFVKPKDLQLQPSKINYNLTFDHEKQAIVLSSDVLAKDVCIQIEGTNVNLSDNYFDILPHQQKVIYLPAGKYIPDLLKKIKIKSLIDTY